MPICENVDLGPHAEVHAVAQNLIERAVSLLATIPPHLVDAGLEARTILDSALSDRLAR